MALSPKSLRISGPLLSRVVLSFTHPPPLNRPPALPSELTAIHDSLFDTLSSAAESANMLTSKVISTRAEQHAKLVLREFLETFNECWNFVVRCEIICRRMIVGLRGAVVSQVQDRAPSLDARWSNLTRIGQIIPPDIAPSSYQPVCQACRGRAVDTGRRTSFITAGRQSYPGCRGTRSA